MDSFIQGHKVEGESFSVIRAHKAIDLGLVVCRECLEHRMQAGSLGAWHSKKQGLRGTCYLCEEAFIGGYRLSRNEFSDNPNRGITPNDMAFGTANTREGLTVRAYIATQALSMFRPTERELDKFVNGKEKPDHSFVARFCVDLADALIAELNRS